MLPARGLLDQTYIGIPDHAPFPSPVPGLTVLITLVAAGLAAQAADVLQQGGWIQILSNPVCDTSRILSQDGVLGRVLYTLIGYIDRPSGLDLTAYGGTVFLMLLLMRIARGSATSRSGLSASATV